MQFLRWLRGEPSRSTKPCLPPGQRVYAVGDIHGRADLLLKMAGLIANDVERFEGNDAITVFLGDYVDRGPESRRVLEHLSWWSPRGRGFSTPIVTLKGNHEDMLLQCVADPEKVPWWLANGGDTAMQSFCVESPPRSRMRFSIG